MPAQPESPSAAFAEAIERGDLPAAIDPQGETARAIADFMARYMERWNACDAAVLYRDFYALGSGHIIQSEDSLRDLLDGIVAGGWHHSIFGAMTIHPVGEGRHLVRVGYTRFGNDGAPLPPSDRLGAYLIGETDKGLRIIAMPLTGRALVPATPIAATDR